MLAGFTKMNHTLKERNTHLPPPPPTSPILAPLPATLPQDHDWPAEDCPPNQELEPPNTLPQAEQPVGQPTRRSTQITRPTKDMIDSVAQQDLEFHDIYRNDYVPQTVVFIATDDKSQVYYEALHEEDCKIQELLADPIAFSAAEEKYMMYYYQAIKCPDKA